MVAMIAMMLPVSCSGKKARSASADVAGAEVFTTASGKEVRINLIKHASLEIVYDSLSFQIDPVEALPPETDYSTYGKADYILVTHEHFDHFDSIAIGILSDSSTMVISNAAVRSMLKSGTELANGAKLPLRNDISIEAVPAYNTTPSHAKFHPKGRDNGYILTLDGLRIYIAGDTEDIPEMSGIQNIDIAFLPCNQPYTMTPEQLANAARMIKPRVLFPYHYNDTPIERVVDLLADEDINIRIRPMK